MTKTQILTDQLREKIISGGFPDGHIPGELELAALNHIGRGTVRAALKSLTDEGLIERRTKTGTVICRQIFKPNMRKKLAGLIMRTSGHIYNDLYHSFLTAFTNAGYSVQSVSTSSVDHLNWAHRNRQLSSVTTAVDHLLEAGPKILVVDGLCNDSIPRIDKIRKQYPLLIDFYDSSTPRTNTGIWFDYKKAGYLAGQYLIKCGCQRPVYFSGYVPYRVRFNPKAYKTHREKLVIEGFRQASLEGGIDPETAVIDCVNDLDIHLGVLPKLLADHRCLPDGFCSVDPYVIDFMKLLLEDFGRIPGNIHFAGIGNTPWSGEHTIISFTSVDFNVASMAEAAVAQASIPRPKRKDIYIAPKLIIRNHETNMRSRKEFFENIMNRTSKQSKQTLERDKS